jgi:hypothetical protein
MVQPQVGTDSVVVVVEVKAYSRRIYVWISHPEASRAGVMNRMQVSDSVRGIAGAW